MCQREFSATTLWISVRAAGSKKRSVTQPTPILISHTNPADQLRLRILLTNRLVSFADLTEKNKNLNEDNSFLLYFPKEARLNDKCVQILRGNSPIFKVTMV